ncbi:MAG: dockerin type I domain-containing protein, partial [Candidatus Paceibacterota bacterium]
NSQTSGVCTVSSSTVHLLTTGTCTIRATQGGNTNYNAATPVDQSFSVTQSVTKFVITDATNGTIDLASLVTIQAQNSIGDLVTGYQQDVTLVVPSPATGGGLVNIVNGVGTTTVSDDTIETITLSLSDTEDTNLDVSSTKQVSFGPGETAQLTISAASTTEMVAGTLLPLNISRRDRLGNSVTAGSESYNLYSDSLGSNKKFYDAESGGNIVTEVLIPNNSSSATVWYYDDKVGTPEITVSDSFPTADGAIGVDDDSMNVTVTGASTASLTLTDPGNLVAGERLAYELSRKDQFGNPSNNGALTVYLYEFSSATSTAFYNSASGGDEISSLIMDSGVATSSFWLYGDKAESFSITASDNGSSPDGPTGINDISDNVSIVSGPVSALTLNNPGDAVVGSRLGYVFTRVDSFGNPVTGGTMFVYFFHDDAVGTSTEFFNSEYDGSPVSSFVLMDGYSSGYVWLYASGVDSYNVTVSDSAPANGPAGLADAVDPVNIFATPIVATRFVILDTPSAIAGDTTAITIQAQDGVGNLDTTYSGSVVLHTSGSATPGGLVSIVGGVGSINIIDTKAETVNLSLSDGSGLDVSSVNSVSFLPGPTNQFLMAGNPSSLAGERVSYSITREDQYANPVTSGTENVYLYSNAPVGTGHFYNAASGGLQISSASILNGLAGTTVWFAGTKAGDWIVDASDNLLGPDGGVGIVDGSSTLSVSPAATSRLSLNDPGDMFNGTRLGYTAERLDAYNNSVTAGSATYYLYSSAGVGTSTVFYPTLSGGAPITNLTFGDSQATANFWYYETKNGVWTVYLSDNSGGPDGASGLVDGEDAVIASAIPIVATKFIIVPAAASSLLGNPVTVAVRAVNNSNDIDTTYQNDVTLNTSGSATGGGLVNIVNGVGQMIINDNVEETVHLTLSDTASTSLDISSSENIIFSRTVAIPSGGGGGGGTIAPTVSFSGLAFPNADVEIIAIQDGQVPVGSLSSGGASGSFTARYNGNLPSSIKSFALVVYDKNKNIAQTKIFKLGVNDQLFKTLLMSPTVDLKQDRVTLGAFEGITGSAMPGYKIELMVDGIKALESATVGSDGTYNLSFNTYRLGLGEHVIKVRQVSGQGNASDYSIEKTFTVIKSFIPRADLNKDNKIDIADWGIFMSRYQLLTDKNRLDLDLNGDGKVDTEDLNLMIKALKG